MGLASEAAAGRLEGLRALRDVLAGQIEAGPEKAQVAALARQLRETLKDIAELEKAVPKGSIVDELKGRRDSRASGAGKAARAAQSGGRGG